MTRLHFFALSGLVFLLPHGVARAQDFDFEEEEDEFDWEEEGDEEEDEEEGEEGEEQPGDLDAEDTLDSTEGPDDDFVIPMDDEGPDEDFDFDEDDAFFQEDQGDSAEQGPGEDTAAIYRAKVQEVKGWAADEEAMEWERYLREYPNSLFQGRIEDRIDELGEAMFDQQLGGSGFQAEVDAGAQELFFATPIHLESIDPRTKLRFGVEWGFPEHLFLIGDYEHQIFRELSVHGAFRSRYSGMNGEVGAKYALIKSTRTNTLLTVLGDLHYNFDPAYPAFRPIVAFGQRLGVADGLDINAQAGVDLHFIDGLSPRYVGGLNATLHANEQVSVFAESSLYMKDIGDDQVEGGFRFNVVTFGIKFVALKGDDSGAGLGKAALAATAPYSSNYWGYHFGAVDLDFNYYMD